MLTLIVAIIISLSVGACFGFLIASIFRTAGCVLLAFLAFGPMTAKAECLPSAQAVWQAHGGGWATYRGSGGNRCWMAGHGHSKRHAARLPVPRERPLQFITRDELRSLLPEKPAAQSQRLNPEAAYAEGLRLMKVYFAEQKAKMAEMKR